MYYSRFGVSIRSLFFLTVVLAAGAIALFFAVKFYPASANTDREGDQTKEKKLVGSGRIIISNNGAGLYVIDADPNNQQNTYTVAGGFFQNTNENPSVSSQTGRIAFAARRGSIGVSEKRIYAMDADGSNPHRVTPIEGLPPGESDTFPIISPDGTKIAFISMRFGGTPNYPDGTPKLPEVFVVNFDGTGLHQVTASEQATGNNATTVATAVAWSGNSLKVSARRGFTNMLGQRVTKTGIYTINPDGSGESLDLELGGLDFTDTLDATAGKTLFHRDNVIYVGSGPDIGTYAAIGAAQAGNARWGNGVRFSPDGSRIVYSSDDLNGSIMTIGSDGSDPVVVRSNMGGTGSGKWWFAAPPIPTPSRLNMEPTVLRLPNDGVTTRQAIPALLDAGGHLMFHAADISAPCGIPGAPCTLNPNNFTYFADGRIRVSNPNNPTGYISLCGTSGGVMGCSIVSVGTDVNYAEVNASVSSANTNGASGPGIFTVRRASTDPNTSFALDFTVAGTAVRGLDYELNVPGNTIFIPPGQKTFDIKVTPLRSAGNKTVTMSVTAQPGANYVTTPGRDTANLTIIDNGSVSTSLSLSTITPTRGGNNGVVLSTINGRNIAPGATVKLSRSGHADLIGANTTVAANGLSVNSVLDLHGLDPGSWDVVVTNPDLSIVKLTNGFTVEAGALVNIGTLGTLISGPSEIRPSHTRSYYDVISINYGNTDAFGVMLFITGLPVPECTPTNEVNCVRIESTLSDIPDIPGQAPFPGFVRQMPNMISYEHGRRGGWALPVLIPRIPAQGMIHFRVSIRFSSTMGLPPARFNAALAPPLLSAASTLGPKPTIAFRPSAPQDATGDKAALCLNSLFQSTVGCALGFIPGEACLRAGIAAIQSVAGVVGGLSVSGTGAVNYFSGAQVYAAGVSLMACALSVTPGITQALNIISCMAGFYDTCTTCFESCKPHDVTFVGAADPNEKAGIRGFTVENYVARSNLLYGISFENEPTATAPAQDVIVTDQLDVSKVDVSTFELERIEFGDTVVAVPPGLKSYTTEVDLRPANDLLVRVNAAVNLGTGLVTWQFQSIDPFTRLPPTNALAGFLPPNIIGTEGRGKVLFTIAPNSLLLNGTEIRNQARIIFDLNAPLDTNEWLNTIDDSQPASQVTTLLPTQSNVSFPVHWSGTDTGSGIVHYSVYVSDNGGPFNLWIYNTTDPTATFNGQIGHQYSYYSVAEDKAGNMELAPLVGDASTLVVGPTAAGVTVSGRVLMNTDGRGVRNARVSITDEHGNVRTVMTGSFGTYRFDDVETGHTYIVSATSRRFQFSPRVLNVVDNLLDIDLIASTDH